MNNQQQHPIHEIKKGLVKAAIWENQGQDGHLYYAISVTRSYKDAEGKWHNTNTYFARDVDLLIECTVEAQDWIKNHVEQLKQTA